MTYLHPPYTLDEVSSIADIYNGRRFLNHIDPNNAGFWTSAKEAYNYMHDHDITHTVSRIFQKTPEHLNKPLTKEEYDREGFQNYNVDYKEGLTKGQATNQFINNIQGMAHQKATEIVDNNELMKKYITGGLLPLIAAGATDWVGIGLVIGISALSIVPLSGAGAVMSAMGITSNMVRLGVSMAIREGLIGAGFQGVYELENFKNNEDITIQNFFKGAATFAAGAAIVNGVFKGIKWGTNRFKISGVHSSLDPFYKQTFGGIMEHIKTNPDIEKCAMNARGHSTIFNKTISEVEKTIISKALGKRKFNSINKKYETHNMLKAIRKGKRTNKEININEVLGKDKERIYKNNINQTNKLCEMHKEVCNKLETNSNNKEYLSIKQVLEEKITEGLTHAKEVMRANNLNPVQEILIKNAINNNNFEGVEEILEISGTAELNNRLNKTSNLTKEQMELIKPFIKNIKKNGKIELFKNILPEEIVKDNSTPIVVNETKGMKEIGKSFEDRTLMSDYKQNKTIIDYIYKEVKKYESDHNKGMTMVLEEVEKRQHWHEFVRKVDYLALREEYGVADIIEKTKGKKISREHSIAILKQMEKLYENPESIKNININSSEESRIAAVFYQLEKNNFEAMTKMGIPIEYLKNRFGLQTHNERVIRKTGFEKWYKANKHRLDLISYNDPALLIVDSPEHKAFCKELFDGILNSDTREGFLRRQNKGFKGNHRGAPHRTIFFKSIEDKVNYDLEFGEFNIYNAMEIEGDRVGRALGYHQIFGNSSADDVIKNVIAKLMKENKKLEALGKISFEERSKRNLSLDPNNFNNEIVILTGANNMSSPANYHVKEGFSFYRAVKSLGILNKVFMSSFTDLGHIGYYMCQYQPKYLKNMYNMVVKLFTSTKNMTPGARKEMSMWFQKRILIRLKDIVSRFDIPSDMTGKIKLQKLLKVFGEVSGIKFWDRKMQQCASELIMDRLGEIGGTYDNVNVLPSAVKNALDADGLTVFFPIIKAITVKDKSGCFLDMFKLDKIRGLSEPVKEAFRTKIDALLDKFGNMATLRPSLRSNKFMYGSTKPGTISGEASRSFWHLKQYSVVLLDTVLNDVLESNIAINKRILRGGLKNIGSIREMSNLFQYFSMTTGLKYLSNSCKRIFAGKYPEDPRKLEVILDTIVDNGVGGIIQETGASLYKSVKAKNVKAITGLGGPLFSDTVDMLTSSNEQRARVLKSYVPFQNHYLVEAGFNAIFNDFMEILNITDKQKRNKSFKNKLKREQQRGFGKFIIDKAQA